jgi:hypothetical protein
MYRCNYEIFERTYWKKADNIGLLISLMMLTVAEKVVREELQKTRDVVLGTEKRKIKGPTLFIILQIMMWRIIIQGFGFITVNIAV